MDQLALDQISEILARGESVQVVGIPGSGISRLGINLAQNNGLLINTNLYPNPTDQILKSALTSTNQSNLIIFDSIERLLLPHLTPFFNYLKAYRDKYKYQLKYVFLNHSAFPVSSTNHQILGDLYSLVSENIFYLKPITDSGIHSRLQQDFYPQLNFFSSKNQEQQIITLSGGIPALIKIIIQSLRDNTSLEMDSNPRLKAQLEEICLALGINPNQDLLQKHGLLNSQNQFRSKLLQNFLEKYSPLQLTAAENRLLNLLQNHLDKIVSKNQICDVVYPEVKNRAGITDHAIDQLIHRLREKIKFQYSLTTHRGLGFMLHNLAS